MLELLRSSARSTLIFAFLNEPNVAFFLPIDWSARIALFKPRRIHYPATRFSPSRNSTKFRVDDPRREWSFLSRTRTTSWKKFKILESIHPPRMESISSKYGKIVSSSPSRNTCPGENSKPRKLVSRRKGKMGLQRFIVVLPRLFESVKLLPEKLSFEKRRRRRKVGILFLGQIRTTFARCRTVWTRLSVRKEFKIICLVSFNNNVSPSSYSTGKLLQTL